MRLKQIFRSESSSTTPTCEGENKSESHSKKVLKKTAISSWGHKSWSSNLLLETCYLKLVTWILLLETCYFKLIYMWKCIYIGELYSKLFCRIQLPCSQHIKTSFWLNNLKQCELHSVLLASNPVNLKKYSLYLCH
jgi:hypothetical protein